MRLQSLARIVLGLIVAAALGLYGTSQKPVRSEAVRSGQQEYRQTVALLDALIQREMADKRIPGFSIALVEDQQIVWQQGYGYSDPQTKAPVTADTVFRVGSVSKLFTDIAVMRLVERGQLDLDKPVTNYLPDFKPRNPFKKPITLRQLMSHRSGLVREPPVGNYFDSSGVSLAETVRSLNRTSLIYEPETHTKYSNAGIATVGYVLERTQKQRFAAYLKKQLLEPLGMKRSDFVPSPEVTKTLSKAEMWTVFGKTSPAPTFELGIAPAGSLYTTAGDLSRFASMIFAASDSPESVLKKKMLEDMWKPQYAKPGQKAGFGIGFAVSDLEGHRMVGHGGAIYGFSTQLSLLPDDKLGVVVISNKDVTNGVTDRIADIALRAMLAEKANKSVPLPEVTLPIPSELAKKLAGRFSSGDKTIDLIRRGDRLSIMDANGGIDMRLRLLGNSLIVDDVLTFGPTITPSADGNSFKLGDKTFSRILDPKPGEAPKNLRGLIGEYGPDYNTTYVFESRGKLWMLIEGIAYEQLEQLSENVFKFPSNSILYSDEQVIFKRDKNGNATEVNAGNVAFKRRQIGPESGNQLLIKPQRPVDELIKEALAAKPPQETGDFRQTDLLELARLDSTIKLEIRYATKNNLFGTVFYSEARAFLQRPAAEAVARANAKLKESGYGLLIHDGYRPWYVTKTFWDATPEDKHIFVADPAKGSRHNRGAAVDLTLYDLKTGKPVEMVSTYDETTDRAYPDYPGGTSMQRWHRQILRDAMESEGFTVYEAEWWHFDYKDWRQYRIGNIRFEDITRE